MQGLDRLLNLPENIRTEIENVYGSVQDLYQKIFDLNAEEYSLTGSNSPRLNQIQAEIYDIEDKLEEFGITDGSDITTEIASDFGEIIVNKQITKLNVYLSQFGTDFDTMRKWLKNKYNI
jgi:frataxin-like iron-binding protein CyaY